MIKSDYFRNLSIRVVEAILIDTHNILFNVEEMVIGVQKSWSSGQL